MGEAWNAAPHFFGLIALISPTTSEPLLQLRARLPLPVMVSLAANFRTDSVLSTMPSIVLLLMVFPPRLLNTELRSTSTPVPVLPEMSIPPSIYASEWSVISIPPFRLLSIVVAPDHSQWL